MWRVSGEAAREEGVAPLEAARRDGDGIATEYHSKQRLDVPFGLLAGRWLLCASDEGAHIPRESEQQQDLYAEEERGEALKDEGGRPANGRFKPV